MEKFKKPLKTAYYQDPETEQARFERALPLAKEYLNLCLVQEQRRKEKKDLVEPKPVYSEVEDIRDYQLSVTFYELEQKRLSKVLEALRKLKEGHEQWEPETLAYLLNGNPDHDQEQPFLIEINQYIIGTVVTHPRLYDPHISLYISKKEEPETKSIWSKIKSLFN